MFQENAKVYNFISHHFDPIQFTTSKTLTETDTSIKGTVANNLLFAKKKKDKDFADMRTK